MSKIERTSYKVVQIRTFHNALPITINGVYREDLVRLYYVTNYGGRSKEISKGISNMVIGGIHHTFPDITDDDLRICRVRLSVAMAEEISPFHPDEWYRKLAIHIIVPKARLDEVKGLKVITA